MIHAAQCVHKHEMHFVQFRYTFFFESGMLKRIMKDSCDEMLTRKSRATSQLQGKQQKISTD